MKSEMDNNEWAGEEMSLERFNRNNPFTVPSGYFEEAGQRILSLAKLDELKGTDTAGGFNVPAQYFDELSANINSRINIETTADTGFTVPEGYFNQLTDNITARVNISAAEEESFAVPAGYFESLTANIQSRIAIEEMLEAGQPSFNVPQGYFENLQEQITARIAVEEMLETVPSQGFEVPEGYFEQLNSNILNKTIAQEAVVRKTVIRKLLANNAFKYATAACFTLIVGAGIFFSDVIDPQVAPQAHQKTLLHSELSAVPVNEIKDYLELNSDNTALTENSDANTKAVDDELSDYVDIN